MITSGLAELQTKNGELIQPLIQHRHCENTVILRDLFQESIFAIVFQDSSPKCSE